MCDLLTIRQVLDDHSAALRLGLPPLHRVSSTILDEWMHDQDALEVRSEGIALFTYLYHVGKNVTDPEMRTTAAATMAVKLSGNYDIVDILKREERDHPGFKRGVLAAEMAILKSI